MNPSGWTESCIRSVLLFASVFARPTSDAAESCAIGSARKSDESTLRLRIQSSHEEKPNSIMITVVSEVRWLSIHLYYIHLLHTTSSSKESRLP